VLFKHTLFYSLYCTIQFFGICLLARGFFFFVRGVGGGRLPGDSFFFSYSPYKKKKEEEDACRAPQTCRLEIELNLRCSLQLVLTSSLMSHTLVAAGLIQYTRSFRPHTLVALSNVHLYSKVPFPFSWGGLRSRRAQKYGLIAHTIS
jgi:hypothetical protein